MGRKGLAVLRCVRLLLVLVTSDDDARGGVRANGAGAPHWRRLRRPGRRAARRHGHGDLAFAAREQTAVIGGRRKVSLPVAGVRPLHAQFELSGFQTIRRENIAALAGADAERRHADASGHAAGNRHRHRRITGRRRLDDESGVGLHRREARWEFRRRPTCGRRSAQAPGVRMLGFDTGGSHKSQQTGYESFGVRNQNRVVTDGVDTTEGPAARASTRISSLTRKSPSAPRARTCR